jgi:hypothetical protein
MAILRRYPRRGLAGPLAILLLLVAGGVRLAHAFTIDGTVGATFTMNDRRTVGINTNANLPVNAQPSITFANGAGANQAKVLYQGKLSLSAGALSVDLNGVLTDSYGSTVSLVRVKAIYIQNNSASNPQTFGAAASNAWATLLNSTGTITLPAGAWFIAATPDATGWAVTAATGDLLKAAGTGTDQFTLVLIGSDT